MADLVFQLFAKLRKTFVIAFRDEERVVAEAAVAMLLVVDAAFYTAFKLVLAAADGISPSICMSEMTVRKRA